jgi:CBS domain containing-hemolysin-like protein
VLLCIQITLVVFATGFFLELRPIQGAWWALLVLLPAFVLVLLAIPIMATRYPEQALLRLVPVLSRCYPFMAWISRPMASLLKPFERTSANGDETGGQEEESTEGEFEAYVDVGEEEGIIEGREGDLILSALEFGNTRVREIMTPRTQVVATSQTTTVSEMRDLIVSRKHSRIPVYRKGLDDIVGVVYVRNLLSYLNAESGDEPVTLLMTPPLFVPETKKVADLFREMQRSAEHIAIVINEYGAVSGLVSIEDLIEEIVGEIRDEDELQLVDLISEGEGSYIVRGAAEIENLEKALGLSLGNTPFTTVSGVVVSQMGRVPHPGETTDINGIPVEVLTADQRKINTLRIRLALTETRAGFP